MVLIQRFLDYLKVEKRFSSHTIRSYEIDLKGFKDFVNIEFPEVELVSVEAYMLRLWIVALSEEHKKASTINRKISSLRSFYKFLLATEIIDHNPTTLIRSLKKERNIPTYIEEAPMLDLLLNGEFEKDYAGYLDKMLLEMFYNTGMRLSELVNLKKMDVDSNNLQIKVLGKRNKERIIPISESMNQSITEFMHHRDTVNAQTTDDIYLFLTPTGKRIYDKFVYRRINNYLSKITTMTKTSPHVIRHTFATHMLNHGADISSIKEILGHANLAATQIYTHNNIEKLKSVYNHAHPKA